jgi:hypothetical protein
MGQERMSSLEVSLTKIITAHIKLQAEESAIDRAVTLQEIEEQTKTLEKDIRGVVSDEILKFFTRRPIELS